MLYCRVSDLGAGESHSPEPIQVNSIPVTTSAEEQDKSISFGGLKDLTLMDIAVTYHDAALGKTIHFSLDKMDGEVSPGKPIIVDYYLSGNNVRRSYMKDEKSPRCQMRATEVWH